MTRSFFSLPRVFSSSLWARGHLLASSFAARHLQRDAAGQHFLFGNREVAASGFEGWGRDGGSLCHGGTISRAECGVTWQRRSVLPC